LVDELADALNLGLQLALVVQVLAHGRSEAAQLLLQRLGHSLRQHGGEGCTCVRLGIVLAVDAPGRAALAAHGARAQLVYDRPRRIRSEEHTSELQSRENLVCRLLLEKKK